MLEDFELQRMRIAAKTGKAVSTLESKFFEQIYKLKTGRPIDATRGLEHRMNISHEFFLSIAKGVQGIQEEVDTFVAASADIEVRIIAEMLRYIRFETTSEKEYPNGIRDKDREGLTLAYFLNHRKAKEAALDEAEVVALRLYTTSAYKFMNNPLRDDARYGQGAQCPLAVTTHFAASGIRKLRALNVEAGAVTLWRGMRNLEAADGFMQSGGTELAFMSTTADLEVAVRYSLSRQSLLFKIVSAGFMTTGADVQWLSAFPGEAEVLYPPLTYLRPTGRRESVIVERDGQQLSFEVIEVNPQLA